MKIKICGLCNKKDIDYIASKGINYIGIIIFPKSPRHVDPAEASKLIYDLKSSEINTVAVTVNPDKALVFKLLDFGFDFIQLHGEEGISFAQSIGMQRVIKAFRIGKEKIDIDPVWKKAHAILLDTYKKGYYGGTGTTFNWTIAKYIKDKGFKIILSGGLNPENVIQAIEEVQPFGVDVSSGIEEKPCRKNRKLVDEFIKKVRSFRK